MLSVTIFTDGACRGNPGPGGWGALLIHADTETALYGAEPMTTNNRMELMAPIKALSALKEPSNVTLMTDSQYVQKGVTEWVHNWKKRGWLTASKQPVKNSDLWQLLEQTARSHTITWRWVRGHSGNIQNERADRLANQAIDEWLLTRTS